MLQVYCVSLSVMSHQSRGKGPKSCLFNFLNCMRVMTGSGDRVSSWADAVVVDGLYATCPWEMLLTGESNQTLSQRGMCIPMALCSIAIVAVVWSAGGLCFSAKTLFPGVGCDICKPSSTLSRLNRCAFHSGRLCTRNMSRLAILIVSIALLRLLRVCFGHLQSRSTLALVYVVNDWYG